MEYLISSKGSFREIETRTVEAFQRAGLLVQRTFCFSPPTPGGDRQQGGLGESREDPGYTVLMLYRAEPPQSPLGLVSLYGRGGQVVLKSQMAAPETGEAGHAGESQDLEAELAAALSLGGLDLCVHAAGGRDCIDLEGLQEVER
jgi:hypothetical protein